MVFGIGSVLKKSPARIASALVLSSLASTAPSNSEVVSWAPGTPAGTRFEIQLKALPGEWTSDTQVHDAADCQPTQCIHNVGALGTGLWVARVRACDQNLCTDWVESFETIKPGRPAGVFILPD